METVTVKVPFKKGANPLHYEVGYSLREDKDSVQNWQPASQEMALPEGKLFLFSRYIYDESDVDVIGLTVSCEGISQDCAIIFISIDQVGGGSKCKIVFKSLTKVNKSNCSISFVSLAKKTSTPPVVVEPNPVIDNRAKGLFVQPRYFEI